jgi:hypothetical protein
MMFKKYKSLLLDSKHSLVMELAILIFILALCTYELHFSMILPSLPRSTWGTPHIIYELESVDRWQMDIKRKIYDIRTCKQIFISRHILHQHWYTCPIALQFVETHSTEVLWLLSQQPLPHLLGHHLQFSNALKRICQPSCEPVYATNTSYRTEETFFL